jgi:hypothetical protein
MPSLQAFRLLETCLGVSLFQLVLGLSLAMRGFHKASERFASAGSSADDAFRALFECVAWAGTINGCHCHPYVGASPRAKEPSTAAPSSMLPTGRSQAGVEDYEKHPQGRDVAATLKAVSAHLQKTNVG